MARTRQGFNQVTRFFAGMVLLLWVSAIVVCCGHCAFGACTQQNAEANAQPNCHGGGDQSDDSSGQSKMVCLNKQSVANSDAQPAIPAFPITVAYFLPVIVEDLAITFESEVQSRQAQTRIWTFTPEVCLGPGMRSHAPPVFA